jgi:hypothetical protein
MGQWQGRENPDDFFSALVQLICLGVRLEQKQVCEFAAETWTCVEQERAENRVRNAKPSP